MKIKANIWIASGLLLIAAALFLTALNLSESAGAGKSAENVLEGIQGSAAGLHAAAGTLQPAESPDYILNPNMEMPTETVEGNEYIGVLQIPALELNLPVMSTWSYQKLKLAPCRYSGSAYLDSMVIAAHNYRSHFGSLRKLTQGDEVTFTDIDGNVFRYEVIEIETLPQSAAEEMTEGDWDLTLFTCTVSGQARVTVRCESAPRGNYLAT